MAVLSFRVEHGEPVAMKRSEVVMFALHEHPDAAGVVFLTAGLVVCRRCIDDGSWLLGLDGIEHLDDRALVVFRPNAVPCSACGGRDAEPETDDDDGGPEEE